MVPMAVLLRSIAEDDDEGDDAGDRDVNSVVLQYTATYHATSTILYYNFIEQWWWWVVVAAMGSSGDRRC